MAKHSEMFGSPADQGDVYGYEESTFSIPKALSLFFGVVLTAGLFFGAGYSMGHTAAVNQHAAAAVQEPVAPASVAPAPVVTIKEKPAAALQMASDSPAAAEATPEPAIAVYSAGNAPAKKETESNKSKAPTTATGSFTVQVAAVRHQEDAEALLGALRKKQYPVFLASANSDSLFHVQVGPFSNQKEAEGMRTRLSGDGYNAILKK